MSDPPWHGQRWPKTEAVLREAKKVPHKGGVENMTLMKRPTTSNADEWQLWLQDGLTHEPASACAFLAVQIVEAIEEHQRALAREVYALSEAAVERSSDLALEDTPEGHYSRGVIAEAKGIARAINAIMPYSRNPAAIRKDMGS